MLGQRRRRLARIAFRIRSAVGYWWLEQSEWWQDRRRPWRSAAPVLRRAAAAVGDRWSDMTRGVRRRTRRVRALPGRVGRMLAAPWVAAARRLRGWSRRRPRVALPRPASRGTPVATRLAAARARTARRIRGLGAGIGHRTRAAVGAVTTAVASAGGRTRRGARAVVSGTRHRLGALTTGVGRGSRAAARSIRTAAAAIGAAFGAVGAGAGAAGAWTGHRVRRLGSAVAGGTARVGTTLTRATRVLSVRRVAVAAAAVVVGFGAVASGVRLVDGREPDLPAGSGAGRAEQAAASTAQGLSSTGPGITSPGIHLQVSPEESGDLEVDERIMTTEPIRVLPLAAPPAAPGDDGPAARLVDLRVASGDAAVPVAGAGEIGDQRQIPLPEPTTDLELRYRVVDADERSETAPPGRATLSLRPAASGALASAPTVVQVRGAVVHTLVCVDAPLPEQLCGVDDRDGWRTETVTAATSNVLALVDLPRP